MWTAVVEAFVVTLVGVFVASWVPILLFPVARWSITWATRFAIVTALPVAALIATVFPVATIIATWCSVIARCAI